MYYQSNKYPSINLNHSTIISNKINQHLNFLHRTKTSSRIPILASTLKQTSSKNHPSPSKHETFPPSRRKKHYSLSYTKFLQCPTSLRPYETRVLLHRHTRLSVDERSACRRLRRQVIFTRALNLASYS